MKFGMPSLIEAPDIRSCFSIAMRLGLSFIELNMNLPEYQPGAVDINLARSLMDDTGIGLTLHLPEALNPCDFDPLVRNAYVESTVAAIEMALQLGCPLVNMHMATGIHFKMPDHKIYLFEQYRDQYLDSLRYFRDVCRKTIGTEDLLVCVENCEPYMPFQIAGIETLLECGRFALTYDVGHAHPSRTDEPFILSHGDRLRHMHLHDALDGAGQSHLALGDGTVDLGRMLEIARNGSCSVVVETKTLAALSKSMEYLQAR